MASTRENPNTPRATPGIMWILLALFFLINLFQAAFTGLFDDEALFWMYGEHLAWGFYEHPPMVGLLIHLGYQIIPGVLGVRLLFVILTTFTLYLILRISGIRNTLLFFALAFSILILQAGGFMAAPDTCLVFFTTLLLVLYQAYLERDNLWLAALIGLTTGLIIYSKYNGILFVLLLLLSNLKILKRPSVYLAALVALLTLIPHVIWSFQHHHPTVFYHLFERNIAEYNFLTYLGEYFPGQFGIYGPLMGFILIPVTILYKPGDTFEKGLKFSALGILVFFLLYTFRGKVEPNWTIQALIPMLILTCRWVEKRKILRRWVYALAIPGILLLLGFRMYLVHDFLHLPRKLVNLSELWYWDEWASRIDSLAEGREVVFLNSYQRAAKYSFYSGKPAYNLENMFTHRTQYAFWPDMEKRLQGKSVLVCDYNEWSCIPDTSSLTGRNGVTTYYGFCDRFQSFNRVPLKFTGNRLVFPPDSLVTIPVRIINPDKDTLRFGANPDLPVKVVYYLFSYDAKKITEMEAADITFLEIPGNGYRDILLTVKIPDQPGSYHIAAGIRSGWLYVGKNMYFQTLKVR